MVVRGAHEHPGAVAVEDELGRVINLSRIPLHVRSLPPCVLPRHLSPGAGCACAQDATVCSRLQGVEWHKRSPSQAGPLHGVDGVAGKMAAI